MDAERIHNDPLMFPVNDRNEALLLQIAGNAVKKASDNLVRAAQKAAFDKADEDNVVVKTKFVGGIAQVPACWGDADKNIWSKQGRKLCFC